ncbi:hypothetical protein TNCV_4238231 [Trichonephila clavipes]|nr:hypothetical protein TNCV_4238231 [Trichonephila clavipes]
MKIRTTDQALLECFVNCVEISGLSSNKTASITVGGARYFSGKKDIQKMPESVSAKIMDHLQSVNGGQDRKKISGLKKIEPKFDLDSYPIIADIAQHLGSCSFNLLACSQITL